MEMMMLLLVFFVLNESQVCVMSSSERDSENPAITDQQIAAQKAAEAAFEEAVVLFDEEYSSDKGWTVAREKSDCTVYSKNVPEGRLMGVSAILEGTPETIMKESWNFGKDNILMINAREFVTARVYKSIGNDGFIMAARSVEYDQKPVTDERVRGTIHLFASRFRPLIDNPKRTRCEVLFLVDLAGNLPTFFVNKVLPSLMVNLNDYNAKHFKNLAKPQ